MLPENPEFVWSLSRNDKFEECALEYFYQYYRSWNGWNWDSELDRRKAYLCKNTTSLFYTFNEAYHDALARLFCFYRSEQYLAHPFDWSPRFVQTIVRNALNKAYGRRNCFDAWKVDPKRNKPLREVLYRDWMNDDFLQMVVETIKEKLADIPHYVDTKTFQEFSMESAKHWADYNEKKAHPDAQEALFQKPDSVGPSDWILEISEDPFKTDFDQFQLNGYTIRVSPDIIYQRMDGTIVAANWKTNDKHPESDKLEAKVIALYIQSRYQVPFCKTCVRTEYVFSDECIEYTPSRRDMKNVSQYITGQIQKMKSFVEGDDLKANIAKDESEFAKAVNHPNCFWCSYRAICKQHCKDEKKAEAKDDDSEKEKTA